VGKGRKGEGRGGDGRPSPDVLLATGLKPQRGIGAEPLLNRAKVPEPESLFGFIR